MNEPVLTPTLKWLWNHKPDLTAIAIIISAIIWTTVKIDRFSHRLDSVEELCIDIHRNQLPEIRRELQQQKKETGEDFQQVRNELSEIKLMLERIDTNLTTTGKNYKGK